MIVINSISHACARGRILGPAERAAVIAHHEGEVARLEISSMIVRPRSFQETSLTGKKLNIARRALQMAIDADVDLRKEGR